MKRTPESRPFKVFVPCFGSCLLLLVLLSAAHAQETVRLQLAWRHQFQFAGYYAALDKGFYRKAGLQVQILEGGPSTNVTEDLKSGRAEYGVGSSSALLSRARGDKIVVLAAVFQYSPAVILVTRQAGIESVKDLQNRRLMDAPNADDIAAMFKVQGVDYQKIPRVQHTGDPRDLMRGKADAMLAYSGNQAFLLEQLGVPCKEFTPRSSGIDFYGDNLITTDQEIAANPDRAEAFRAASMKGWRYAFSHKAEIADLILRRYSKAKSRNHLLYEANQYETLVQPDLVELGYQSSTRWQSIANAYKSLGMMETATVPDGLIYKTEVHAVPRWVVPVLLTVLALSLAGFGLNMRISRLNRRLKCEIDERRQAELAIAAARDETEVMHEQLVGMSEALPVAMFQLEVGPDGKPRYNFLSHRAEELLGIPHAELLATPADRWRHVHPDDLDKVAQIRMDGGKQAPSTEAERQLEFTARVEHGCTTRWLLANAHATPARPDGTVVWNGFYQDVTSQKEAEATITTTNEQLAERSAELAQALGNTSSRLQGIMDNSPAAIWAKDENGVYLFANAAYHTMFGVGSAEVEGRTDDDFFPRETAEGFRANDRNVIRERKTSSFVEKVGLPNGVEFVLSVKFPLFDQNGEAYAAAGMCLDISEQLHLQEELEKLNEELEDRVEGRTAELSQAYEALRDSESRLSKTTENAPCLIYQFMMRRDGTAYFPYCSAFTKTYFGVDPEEVREDAGPILSLFHPDDVPGYLAAVERAVADQGIFKHEWRFRFPDGRITWAQATARPEFVAGGDILWNGVLMDITERMQVEQALSQREAEFRSLIDNIPGVVYRCEAHGDLNMLFVSDEVERLTGYPASDFMAPGGRNFNDLIYTDDRDIRRNALRAAVAEGHPYEPEYRVIHRDGSVRWISCLGQAVRDEDGSPLYFIGTMFDTTQRKQAEQALRESQLRIDLAAEAGEITFADYDIQGERHWLRGHVSRLMFSLETNDIPAAEWQAFILPEDRERVADERERVLKSDETDLRLEYRVTDPRGAVHWLELRGKVLRDGEGQAQRVTAIILDATERKQVEAALQAARQAADESNKAKSDFLANMSHEIRTPMNAVIGMTHLALQTDLNNSQRNYLQKISGAAHNLLGIINDILDFSKIEAGKLQMEIIDFNLDEVLQNVADVFMEKAQDRGVEFLFRWEPGVPALLSGDPLRIGQILINLTGNAFKFTENGEVEVRVEKTAETEENVTLQFSVRDTGIGMTQEQQGRLFQAFSQADASTTRKYGGTGLGLTICKRLVEMMHGTIWLDSEPGAGTTFYFTAVLGKSVAAPSSGNWEIGELAGLRVLVVDDNATSREILQGILKTFHFDPVVVPSGKDALELLRTNTEQPFDLVLMDWQMPDMDGIEVARRIRSDPTLPLTPPIIMVSAYGREELMRQAAKIGISGYLIKPVNPSLMLDTIVQVFGKGGQLTTTNTFVKSEDESCKLQGLRVLLVEDNEVNCEVAVDLLTGAGITVTVAHDGEEGVAAVRSAADADQLFDAVLMDCQMPVLDGYDATRLLRQEGRFADLPIIAMTANAMAGDREKCLEAGMNDHISKPIDVRKLFTTIVRLTHPESPSNESGAADTQPRNMQFQNAFRNMSSSDTVVGTDLVLPGVDVADGLSHVRGNLVLYRRILTKFREGQAGVVDEVRAAHQVGDNELAVRLAHTLKGVAGNIGAKRIFDSANDLEQMLKEKPSADIEKALEEISAQLEPLVSAIAGQENEAAAAPDIPPAAESRNAKELDRAALEPLLAKLEDLLQRSNTKASAAIEELKPHLSGMESEAVLMRVSKAIGDYDFDAALTHYSELARLLEESSK